MDKKLWKKVGKMELGNPVLTTLVGLVVFYIGLKMFAGGIVMTLLWQSSSLSTTAIIGLVASGAVPLPAAIAAVLGANIGTTGTIWLAGALVSDGMPKGDTLRIAMAHTGVNLLMAISLLPFVRPIAQWITKVTT